jgi:hypothetical protein
MNTRTKDAVGILSLILSVWVWPRHALAQPTVSVSFTTTNSTPLNSGFAGFNTAMLTSAAEYSDTNFQHLAATLSPGWLRYPAGTRSDAFDWSNGLTLQSWVNEWNN